MADPPGVSPWSCEEGLPVGFVDVEVAADDGEHVELLCLMPDYQGLGTVEPPPRGHLLGFDVGVFESADNVYSVIFHEVVFGKLEKLTAFSCRLNEHLLLSSVADAKDLLDSRARCFRAEPGALEVFECDDGPCIFAVWRLERGKTGAFLRLR